MPKPQRLSEASVLKGTGKGWSEWFKLLDEMKAPELGHKETARRLQGEQGLSAWWSQTVAIHYEWERGLREPGERSRGFGLSVQRTIGAPVEEVWRAWTDGALLSVWFDPDFEVELRVGGAYSNRGGDRGRYLTIDPPKRLRFTWDNPQFSPGSLVEIEFQARDRGRTAVRVSHEKLDSQQAVDEFKEGWTWALESVKSYLERGLPVQYEQWKAERDARK